MKHLETAIRVYRSLVESPVQVDSSTVRSWHSAERALSHAPTLLQELKTLPRAGRDRVMAYVGEFAPLNESQPIFQLPDRRAAATFVHEIVEMGGQAHHMDGGGLVSAITPDPQSAHTIAASLGGVQFQGPSLADRFEHVDTTLPEAMMLKSGLDLNLCEKALIKAAYGSANVKGGYLSESLLGIQSDGPLGRFTTRLQTFCQPKQVFGVDANLFEAVRLAGMATPEMLQLMEAGAPPGVQGTGNATGAGGQTDRGGIAKDQPDARNGSPSTGSKFNPQEQQPQPTEHVPTQEQGAANNSIRLPDGTEIPMDTMRTAFGKMLHNMATQVEQGTMGGKPAPRGVDQMDATGQEPPTPSAQQQQMAAQTDSQQEVGAQADGQEPSEAPAQAGVDQQPQQPPGQAPQPPEQAAPTPPSQQPPPGQEQPEAPGRQAPPTQPQPVGNLLDAAEQGDAEALQQAQGRQGEMSPEEVQRLQALLAGQQQSVPAQESLQEQQRLAPLKRGQMVRVQPGQRGLRPANKPKPQGIASKPRGSGQKVQRNVLTKVQPKTPAGPQKVKPRAPAGIQKVKPRKPSGLQRMGGGESVHENLRDALKLMRGTNGKQVMQGISMVVETGLTDQPSALAERVLDELNVLAGHTQGFIRQAAQRALRMVYESVELTEDLVPNIIALAKKYRDRLGYWADTVIDHAKRGNEARAISALTGAWGMERLPADVQNLLVTFGESVDEGEAKPAKLHKEKSGKRTYAGTSSGQGAKNGAEKTMTAVSKLFKKEGRNCTTWSPILVEPAGILPEGLDYGSGEVEPNTPVMLREVGESTCIVQLPHGDIVRCDNDNVMELTGHGFLHGKLVEVTSLESVLESVSDIVSEMMIVAGSPHAGQSFFIKNDIGPWAMRESMKGKKQHGRTKKQTRKATGKHGWDDDPRARHQRAVKGGGRKGGKGLGPVGSDRSPGGREYSAESVPALSSINSQVLESNNVLQELQTKAAHEDFNSLMSAGGHGDFERMLHLPRFRYTSEGRSEFLRDYIDWQTFEGFQAANGRGFTKFIGNPAVQEYYSGMRDSSNVEDGILTMFKDRIREAVILVGSTLIIDSTVDTDFDTLLEGAEHHGFRTTLIELNVGLNATLARGDLYEVTQSGIIRKYNTVRQIVGEMRRDPRVDNFIRYDWQVAGGHPFAGHFSEGKFAANQIGAKNTSQEVDGKNPKKPKMRKQIVKVDETVSVVATSDGRVLINVEPRVESSVRTVLRNGGVGISPGQWGSLDVSGASQGEVVKVLQRGGFSVESRRGNKVYMESLNEQLDTGQAAESESCAKSMKEGGELLAQAREAIFKLTTSSLVQCASMAQATGQKRTKSAIDKAQQLGAKFLDEIKAMGAALDKANEIMKSENGGMGGDNMDQMQQAAAMNGNGDGAPVVPGAEAAPVPDVPVAPAVPPVPAPTPVESVVDRALSALIESTDIPGRVIGGEHFRSLNESIRGHCPELTTRQRVQVIDRLSAVSQVPTNANMEVSFNTADHRLLAQVASFGSVTEGLVDRTRGNRTTLASRGELQEAVRVLQTKGASEHVMLAHVLTKALREAASPLDEGKRQASSWGKKFQKSGPFRINVGATSVADAVRYAERTYKSFGLSVEDDLPNLDSNTARLRSVMRYALDIPRIDMPVIEPTDIKKFEKRLAGGHLDIFQPWADLSQAYGPEFAAAMHGDRFPGWADMKGGAKGKAWVTLGLLDGDPGDDKVRAKIEMVEVGKLKPLQSEIWYDKLIASILGFGVPTPGSFILTNATIIVSKEGYILDGHHRFGQAMLASPKLKIKALKIDLDIDTLLKVGRSYGSALGRAPKP